MKKSKYYIRKNFNESGEPINSDYQLPIYLDAKAKELGHMMPFDGNVYQTAEPNVTANFVYTVDGSMLTIYNTTDFSQLKNNAFPEVVYTINWGNGDSSSITANGYTSYSSYSNPGIYKIQITLDAPWIQENTYKFVSIESGGNTCRILTELSEIIDDENGNYLDQEQCEPILGSYRINTETNVGILDENTNNLDYEH